MLVKVQLSTGFVAGVDVDARDTVGDVKRKIEAQEGIAAAQQRLLYQGTILNNQRTVEELNLRAGVTLQLVVNLRGG